MFDYLEAKQIGGQKFSLLTPGTRIFKPSFAYRNEKKNNSGSAALKDFFVAYLVDESLAPWDKVEDAKGVKIHNLYTFDFDDKNATIQLNGEEREVTSIDYNYFNWPTKAAVSRADGGQDVHRQKWLDGGVRAQVVFNDPIEFAKWSKEKQAEEMATTQYAKVDFPVGVFGTIMEKIEDYKTIKEAPDMALTDIQASFKYTKGAEPAKVYTAVKVEPQKIDYTVDDLAKIEEEFKQRKPSFTPPSSPTGLPF